MEAEGMEGMGCVGPHSILKSIVLVDLGNREGRGGD